MTSKQLKIEYVKIDTVKPWDRNPKLHNIQAIISSMNAFDITQPILIQRKSGRIIDVIIERWQNLTGKKAELVN